MIRKDFSEEIPRDETSEEYVQNRVADINKKRGFFYAQKNPEFPEIQKEKNKLAIKLLCDDIDAVLPDVKKLIKRIFPHIKSITEQSKIVASYLLLGRAYGNLQTALLLCRNGRNLEAMEISRSGKEALDLVMLFWEDQNTPFLEKWFKGEIIKNATTREFQHKHLNKELADTFDYEEQPIKEMLGSGYKIMSNYTHSGYAGLLDSIDVFKLDFDFEGQAGYHYCIDNFHIVEDLLIKILINLKNSFLHLKDRDGFMETKKISKPFDSGLNKEEMKKIISRYR